METIWPTYNKPSNRNEEQELTKTAKQKLDCFLRPRTVEQISIRKAIMIPYLIVDLIAEMITEMITEAFVEQIADLIAIVIQI